MSIASDKEWMAQDDARTLARAEEIKADPSKLANAKSAAGRIVKEEEARLKGIQKVAGKKVKVEESKPEPNPGPELTTGGPVNPSRLNNGKTPGTW